MAYPSLRSLLFVCRSGEGLVPPKKTLEKQTDNAIRKLIGKPVLARPKEPETPATRIHALQAEIRVRQRVNPYQSDLYKFVTELVWTKDEARGGEVRQFPSYPFIRDYADDYIIEPLQMWEKSRRMLGSWFASAADLWVAAGGQDPRWLGQKTTEFPNGIPVLMRSIENRQVIIAARKLEDIQGSSWFLNERVRFIYDQLVMRGIHEKWPGFPTFTFSETVARGSNGGRINAVPQGPDVFRGAGATMVRMEEGAFMSDFKRTLAGMGPTLTGGGHCLVITTAESTSYAAEIALDKIDP